MNRIIIDKSTLSFERRLFEIQREIEQIRESNLDMVTVREMRYDLRGYEEKLMTRNDALRFYTSMTDLLIRLIETTNYWSAVTRTLSYNTAQTATSLV